MYPCTCTRRDTRAGLAGDDETVYAGRCRAGPGRPGTAAGWRFRVPEGRLRVVDRLQPPLEQDLRTEAGDFLLKRRDGAFAYQLAVVVDDAAAGITDVVRGADLWTQTPRQRALQQALGLPAPRYLHLPLVVEPDGRKLSKSDRALALDPRRAGEALAWALGSLGLTPPAALHGAAAPALLQWAVRHWDPLAGGRRPVPAP